MSHEILGGTYALNCEVTLKDGAWEASQPFAVSESFKLEVDKIVPFNVLHADVRSAIHSCVAGLNGETNGQPHLIKWAFKEAYHIREKTHYGFIIECLVTMRAVLHDRAQAELFKPTPMLLVSLKKFPRDRYHIEYKLPVSTLSLPGASIYPWTGSLGHMSAAGNVVATINNNDPDLTKHAWGLKCLYTGWEHLFVVAEWQHAGLVHIPPPTPDLSALPPSSAIQPPPYAPPS